MSIMIIERSRCVVQSCVVVCKLYDSISGVRKGGDGLNRNGVTQRGQAGDRNASEICPPFPLTHLPSTLQQQFSRAANTSSWLSSRPNAMRMVLPPC